MGGILSKLKFNRVKILELLSKKNLSLNQTKLNYSNKLRNIENERLKKTLNKLIEAYNDKNN